MVGITKYYLKNTLYVKQVICFNERGQDNEWFREDEKRKNEYVGE